MVNMTSLRFAHIIYGILKRKASSQISLSETQRPNVSLLIAIQRRDNACVHFSTLKIISNNRKLYLNHQSKSLCMTRDGKICSGLDDTKAMSSSVMGEKSGDTCFLTHKM